MKLFLPTPQGISQAALRVGDSGGPLVVINGLVFQCLRMQCACSAVIDKKIYSGSVCSLQPFKEKATVACDPPYACWPAIQTTEARAHNKKREVELRHDKSRDLFAFRRHTCMHFRLFAAIEKGLLQRF